MSTTDIDKPIALELVNIHKSFGDLSIIKGVSLKAYEGDVISIIGASGSGKSTLLRCINLLENPSQGEIRVFGETLQMAADKQGDLQATSIKQLRAMREKIGFVFQNFNLWPHKTVIENLIEAPTKVLKQSKEMAIEKSDDLLHKVGLFERRDYYPSQLSGGQQQRVAIARALAMDPEILLFDEPTSSLDPELVDEVLSTMKSLADEKRTMLVVTHEMAFAREVSSKMIFLHQGLVEAEGAPEYIFNQADSPRLKQFLSREYEA